MSVGLGAPGSAGWSPVELFSALFFSGSAAISRVLSRLGSVLRVWKNALGGVSSHSSEMESVGSIGTGPALCAVVWLTGV